MARAASRFVCQSCGEAFLRWEGQCRGCGAWNSLVETIVRESPRKAARVAGGVVAGRVPEALGGVSTAGAPRRPTGIGELDRVLGGGLVDGALVVLGGEPGIGKSTLVLQVAAAVADAEPERGVLYATGEESVGQVRLRAERLGLLSGPAAGIAVVAETDVERIVELIRTTRPALAIVDSIQTIRVDELDGPPGSVGQVRESAARLHGLAKDEAAAVVLVGHVTKDGSLAGPRTLEHLVDVVLGLEGERSGSLRLLRSAKNRFGSTEEVGVFEMGEGGLVGVEDPARAFIADRAEPAPGSVVSVTIEGTRPILVEVQALVSPSSYAVPTRRASGIDTNRLALLLAVLGRRAGVGLSGHDVYVNLAGGFAIDDPGLDLAVAMALTSSLRDRPLPAGTVALGEVGLLGELRPVPRLERRLREAARLGFDRAIVPRGRAAPTAPPGVTVDPRATLGEALAAALAGERVRP